jgi:hypothetical protein
MKKIFSQKKPRTVVVHTSDSLLSVNNPTAEQLKRNRAELLKKETKKGKQY